MYHRLSSYVDGQLLSSDIKELPELIAVGSAYKMTVPLSREETSLLPNDGRRDDFLVIKLVYEDARRNLYVYRLSLTALGISGSWYTQAYSEKLWRVAYHERSYIFDDSNMIIETSKTPLFSRGLYPSFDDAQ